MNETKHRKVQIFEHALNRLATMGLKPNEQLLNARVIRYIAVHCLCTVSSVMYVILEANTFREYPKSIFNAMANAVGLLFFLILTAQSKKLFELRDHTNKVVEASEYIVHFIQSPLPASLVLLFSMLKIVLLDFHLSL